LIRLGPQNTTIVVLFAGFAYAADSSNPALIRLVTVDRLALGGVGFAGLTTSGEADFQTVASRSSGLAEFETILLVGNPQAQAYALMAFISLRPCPLPRTRTSVSQLKTESADPAMLPCRHENPRRDYSAD
jgi:hypothetical protein